jgi:hypothetical protein
MADSNWPTFAPAVTPLLGDEDDPALWSAVIDAVYPDARALCRVVPAGWAVATQLGRCSHWLRPHQTRWTADGGFTWPTGYGGPRWSRVGLPEFDWSREWCWRPEAGWEAADAVPGPRRVVLRVAVPARSRRHRQARADPTPSRCAGWAVGVLDLGRNASLKPNRDRPRGVPKAGGSAPNVLSLVAADPFGMREVFQEYRARRSHNFEHFPLSAAHVSSTGASRLSAERSGLPSGPGRRCAYVPQNVR